VETIGRAMMEAPCPSAAPSPSDAECVPMPNLRKAARGRDCTVRIPGVCNHNPETTVLAHIRRGGVAGMGQKPPDVCAVLACSDCHDAIDGRVRFDCVIDHYILDAMCRTLAIWHREGLVK
jgi:hypothetical protein